MKKDITKLSITLPILMGILFSGVTIGGYCDSFPGWNYTLGTPATINSNMSVSPIAQPYVGNQQCNFGGNYSPGTEKRAYYIGQKIQSNAKSYFLSNGSFSTVGDWIILSTSNIKLYNPNVLATSVNNRGIGSMPFESIARPGNTLASPGEVRLTSLSSDTFAYNNPGNRNQLAAQIVINGHYQQIRDSPSVHTNNTTMYYRLPYASPLYSNITRERDCGTQQFTNLNTCRNYYVARCGDGVKDNTSKPGGINTDGKQGMNTAEGFITREDSSFAAEECDGTDGVPSGYTCTSSCKLQANVVKPTCSLTTSNTDITIGQSTTLNASYTNAVVASFRPTVAGLTTFTYPNRSQNNISVSPIVTTNYILVVTGAIGTTPMICSMTINVAQTAKLYLKKTLINNILYRSGDLVSFRIDFKNIGTIATHNTILTDWLPPALTYESSQLYGVNLPYNFGTGINVNGDRVIYSGFILTPGQSGYMIVTGRFKGYQRSQKTWNNAFLDSDETDQLNDAAKFDAYAPSGNAIVTKLSDKTSYYPGEDVKFTISVTNNGPDVIDTVQLSDVWPTNNNSCLTIDSSRTANTAMTMTSNTNPYVWNFTSSMTLGQIAYLYLTGHIANNQSCIGLYTNVVNLKYIINGASKTGQAQATINVIATPASTMTIEKTITTYGNTSGDPISYELIYKNNGTATITSYDIVDYRPGTLIFNSASPMPNTQTTTPGGALLHWIFTNSLKPNESGKITINGTIK